MTLHAMTSYRVWTLGHTVYYNASMLDQQQHSIFGNLFDSS